MNMGSGYGFENIKIVGKKAVGGGNLSTMRERTETDAK